MIVSTICWKPIAFQTMCEMFAGIISFNHNPIPAKWLLSSLFYPPGKCGSERLWHWPDGTWLPVSDRPAVTIHTLSSGPRNKKCFFTSHIFFLNNEEQQLWATAPVSCTIHPLRTWPWSAPAPSPADGRCALVVITDRVVLFIYVFTIQLDIVS